MKNNKLKNTLPKMITFGVTQGCNCRCEMCRFWSEDSSCANEKELSFDSMKKIILNIKGEYDKRGEKLFLGLLVAKRF